MNIHPPTPQFIAAKGLRSRKLLLMTLFLLAISALLMASGLVAFQLWQLWQFDAPSWLALSGLCGIATLGGMAYLLHLLLAWRNAEAMLIGYAEALTGSRPPLPCRLEIPEYQRRAAKNLVPLFSLQLPADEFSTAREEILALSALNIPPHDDGDGVFWQGDLNGKAIRILAIGRRLLTGFPVTEHTLKQHLARQAKIITQGSMLGGMLTVGLITGFIGLEALEIQDKLQNARQSANWPTEPGVVLASETQSTQIRRGKRQVDAYRALIRYSYVAGGKTFEGSTLHFAYEPDTRRELSDDIIRRYRIGASVTVYHHPQRPWVSALEPGHADGLSDQLDNRIVLLFLLPFTLLIVGAVLAVIMPLTMKAHESRYIAFIRRSSTTNFHTFGGN